MHKVTTSALSLAWKTFEQLDDKNWSYTDCTSKVVMEQLNIKVAFAFDHHFRRFRNIDHHGDCRGDGDGINTGLSRVKRETALMREPIAYSTPFMI